METESRDSAAEETKFERGYVIKFVALFILAFAAGAGIIRVGFALLDPALEGWPYAIAVAHLLLFMALESLIIRIKRLRMAYQVALHLLAFAIAFGLAFVVQRR
jgi:hypothetical protein